jgi:YHS domain-containing protein
MEKIMKNEINCPVMGHAIEDINTAPSSEYQSTTYYFCCPNCKEKFDIDPTQYIGQGGVESQHECHCH